MARKGLALTDKSKRGRYDYELPKPGSLPQRSAVEEIRFSCINCGERIRYVTAPEFYPLSDHSTEHVIRKLKDNYNSILRMVYGEYSLDPSELRESIVGLSNPNNDLREFYFWELHLASKILDVKVPSTIEIQCPYCKVAHDYEFDTNRFHTLDSSEVIEKKVNECLSEFNRFHAAFIEVMTTSPRLSDNLKKMKAKHFETMEALRASKESPETVRRDPADVMKGVIDIDISEMYNSYNPHSS